MAEGYISLQVGFQRMSGNPLTPDEVFASRGDAESFCSDPTCYVGKTLAYRDEEGRFCLAIVQEGDPRTLEDLGMGGDVEFTVENKWTDDGYVSTGGALVDGKMVVCGICVDFTKLVPSYGSMSVGSTVQVADRTFILTLTRLLDSYKAPLHVWLRDCYAPCHFFTGNVYCFSFPYVDDSNVPMHGCFMLDMEGNITNRSVPMVSYGSANQVLAANGQLVNLPTAAGMLDSITGADETASRKALDNTNGKGTVDTCVELNYNRLTLDLSPSFISKVRQGMQVSVIRTNSSGYDVHYPAAVHIGSDIVISFFESPSSGVQVSLYRYSSSGQYKSNVSFNSAGYLTSSQVEALINNTLMPFYLLNSISSNSGVVCTTEGYEYDTGGFEVGQLYVPGFSSKEIIRCTSSSATKSEFHERVPFVKGCGGYMVKHVVAKGTYNGNSFSTIELNDNILDSSSPVSIVGLNIRLNVLSSASDRDLWLEAVPLAYVKEFRIFKSGTGASFYIRASDGNGNMQDVKFKFIIYETDTI